jgi:hypothetical protein
MPIRSCTRRRSDKARDLLNLARIRKILESFFARALQAAGAGAR